MIDNWRIVYYKSPAGKFPVKEFIDNLDEKSQVRIHNTFELLIEFGVRLGLPHAKKITGTPLWGLRILGGKSLRFFYVARVGKKFLLLHGFVKRKQKTPKKEIKIALDRLKHYEA